MTTLALESGTVELAVPEEFFLVEKEDYGKYVSSGTSVPVCAWRNEKTDTLFSVFCTGTELKPDNVEQRIASYWSAYKRMVPGFVPGQLRTKQINGNKMAVMSYQSNAPTKDLMNVLAVFSLKGQEVLLLYGGPLDEKAPSHLQQAVRILESISIKEE